MIRTILVAVAGFGWAVGLVCFQNALIRAESDRRSGLALVSWEWARPKSPRGKALARWMTIWLLGGPVVIGGLWWCLFG